MSDRERYLIALSERLCPLAWRDGLASLSDPERVFVTVWELEAELNNGGFSQFYWNSAGDHAVEVVQSLETIGAPGAAAIVRRANALFPEGPPDNLERRTDALESVEEESAEHLDRLTGEFCAYPENLSELLYAFVQANRERIRGA